MTLRLTGNIQRSDCSIDKSDEKLHALTGLQLFLFPGPK